MSVHVLYLVKYENDQKSAMRDTPAMRDRAEIHRKAIADFGGKPIAQFGSYGEYDMVYIYEMPDEKSAGGQPPFDRYLRPSKIQQGNPFDE